MPSQRFKGFTVLKGLEGLERLTVESEEGEVPHLRWSQAPPLPWPRPGSADNMCIYLLYILCAIYIYIYIKLCQMLS